MPNKMMVGKIIEVRGTPGHHSYIIQDGDGETYLVHLGDIGENEDLLYQLRDEGKLTMLKEGDSVQFEPSTSKHAIHVKVS